MSTHRFLHTLLTLTGLAHAASAATIVTFDYQGTRANNGTTISMGSFSFEDSALPSVTLPELTSFTLHQTVSNSDGTSIALFDFAKGDLLSFAVSLTNGQVTSAQFETDFNLQTSSPTGDLYKSQNFIAISAATGKTQYRDQMFPNPPPPTDDTAGPLAFSSVPEPSSAALLLYGWVCWAVRGRRPSRRCSLPRGVSPMRARSSTGRSVSQGCQVFAFDN